MPVVGGQALFTERLIMADEMYDESEPTMAEDASVANGSNDTKDDNKSDETEDQLALVPTLLQG